MRRNAIHFAVAASLVLVLSGCSQKKSGADLANDPAYGAGLDDYDYATPSTDSAYASNTTGSDPYAAYPSAQSYDAGTTASDPSLTGSSMGGARYHTVAKGDTLYALARRYYGEQRRWKDIYEANRNSLSDPNKIRIGQRLLIP